VTPSELRATAFDAGLAVVACDARPRLVRRRTVTWSVVRCKRCGAAWRVRWRVQHGRCVASPWRVCPKGCNRALCRGH
jgi:hypothetical protein